MTEKKISVKTLRYFYLLFRVIVGSLFFLHGVQKMFGLFGSMVVETGSLLWWAAIIEFITGSFIALGIFVRPMAILAALEMVCGIITQHLPAGINPLTNGAEPALLYFASFLAMIRYGGKKFSLEKLFEQKNK